MIFEEPTPTVRTLRVIGNFMKIVATDQPHLDVKGGDSRRVGGKLFQHLKAGGVSGGPTIGGFLGQGSGGRTSGEFKHQFLLEGKSLTQESVEK